MQYAKWLAASRFAAKGKTMADSGYDAEVKSIMAFLSMQHPASQPAINPATLDINVEDYVAPRFLRKMKSKVCILMNKTVTSLNYSFWWCYFSENLWL